MSIPKGVLGFIAIVAGFSAAFFALSNPEYLREGLVVLVIADLVIVLV